MENPLKIPTDNLYKFKAIAYLTLLVVFIITIVILSVYLLPTMAYTLKDWHRPTFTIIGIMEIFTLSFFAYATYKKVVDSFELWQKRLQDYQDIIIKKEAEREQKKNRSSI